MLRIMQDSICRCLFSVPLSEGLYISFHPLKEDKMMDSRVKTEFEARELSLLGPHSGRQRTKHFHVWLHLILKTPW